MTRYAAETEVPVPKSKAAIESLLIQHGAKEYATGWSETHDRIQFELLGQHIRFVLPRPDRKARSITHDRRGRLRPATAQTRVLDQYDRQRWRAMYLVIRAKLEAVEAGIAIFEQEFLAFIVGPGGLTIGDILLPRLQAGTMWPALPDTNETGKGETTRP
jgi:hypothetical protein